ncbi:MAG TPA: hypothetical protein ENK31_04655, partial [Nannocystis exedens]|nr:hypothetical protein [Nannocystis exedens]
MIRRTIVAMWIRSTLLALLLFGCTNSNNNSNNTLRPLVATPAETGSKPPSLPQEGPEAQTSNTAVPPAPAPQEPPLAMVEKPARSSVPLAIQKEAVVRLQPTKAHTSANLVEGSVDDLAFFGER